MTALTVLDRSHPCITRRLWHVKINFKVKIKPAREARMGALATLAKGFDPDYPWRSMPEGRQGQHGGADYYMSPAEAGGEPPGRWNGPD